MSTPLLVFGHSHVWTLKGAVVAGKYPKSLAPQVLLCGTSGFPGSPVLRSMTGAITLNPVLLAALNGSKQSAPPDQSWLLSMAQGNHYNKLGVTWQDRPFDLILPGHETRPLNADATLLPAAALQREFEAELQNMADFLQRVSKLGYRGTIVLGVCPPERDATKRLELLRSQTPDAEATALTAPDTLWKLWEMQNQVMEAICARHGVHYLRGDIPGTVTPDGFLRPEFAKDAAHATVDYSARALEAVAALITQQKAS